jgi:predicted methyltransferase
MRQHALAFTSLIASTLFLTACSGAAESTPDVDAEASVVEAVETVTETMAEMPSVSETSAKLAAIIADPRRAEDAARDQFRNPQATLEFFDIAPGKRVAEIWPGYYSEILAPYLAGDGTYVAVLFPDGVSERIDARNAAYKEKYGDADVYGTIDHASFSQDTGLSLEDGSVDTILTFRNVHSWMRGNYAESAFAEFYRALAPGGTLGVVAHRLPETATQDPNASSGYVQESYMKALAADAGFEFLESSEVNANPNDTADHPFGVWTLPPRSRTPEDGTPEAEGFDAAAYLAIGESDRATLKFKKPE